MQRVVRAGGGNLPIPAVEFKVGGNAANTGLALARLGARVHLITRTDAFGMDVLGRAARRCGLGVDHVRVGGRTSATVALEFGGANVMLSHAGPLDAFGPTALAPRDWRRLEAADAVVVTNWAQNRRGTPLLAALVRRLGGRGVFLYVDTGDPRPRAGAGPRLARQASLWSKVGAWSLNENEVRAFLGRRRGDPLRLGLELSRHVPCRLDLHTRRWAASIRAGRFVRAPALRAPARRLTGAGDAWNAGNLAGYLLGWPDRDRLRLAHRVATKYVAGERDRRAGAGSPGSGMR